MIALMVLAAFSLTLESLIPIIVAIIVICILCYALSILLAFVHVPPPIGQLIWLLVAVVVLIWILSALGLIH